MADRVASFRSGGSEGFQDFIVGQSLIRSATEGDAEGHFPPFSQVKRVAAELRLRNARSAGSSDADLLAIAEQEIADLREAANSDKDVYEGLVKKFELDAKQAQEEVDQARATNMHLQERVRRLERQVQACGTTDVMRPRIPESLDEFEEWCRAELSGSVEVLNRAFQGIKKSKFSDVPLIYKTMLLLKERYVPMRREGGIERKSAYEDACREIGLSDEPTFSGDRWGEQGDEYKVRYAGRFHILDRHLKKGNSKDQRFCFRVYFFWDEETEQVVVGWLPSHLDTRLT